MNKKRAVVVAVTLALVLIVVGVVITVGDWWRSGIPEQRFHGGLTVVDGLGRTVNIPQQPERIVSLAPSNTEILYALELGDKVVGVTEYCDYPPEAKEKEKIGSYVRINIEKVVALEPDLVLGVGKDEPIVKELENLGLTVVILEAQTIDDVLENIKLVGRITGQVEIAQELMANMEQRIKATTKKTENLTDAQRPRVYYEISPDPLMAAGPGTWHHNLIELAGGVNIAADAKTKYPVYSLELLLERNPEVIIMSTRMGTQEFQTVEQLKAREGWQTIDAVRNDRVYMIERDIIARSGPRLVDALEQMAKFIHPELFG